MKMNLMITVLSLWLVTFGVHAGVIADADRFWTFDGTYDDSVTGLAGTSPGGALFGLDRDGNLGGALLLDGINDTVLVETSSDLGQMQSMSLSLWFYFDELTERSYLFDNRGDQNINKNPTYVFWDPLDANNQSLLGIFGVSFLTDLTLNQWNHLVYTNHFTNDSSTDFLKVYLNGQEIRDQNAQGHLYSIDTGTIMGGLNNTHSSGGLDDVMFWSRSLTFEEVEELYTTPASATVPEPATSFILALGLFLFAVRRQCKLLA